MTSSERKPGRAIVWRRLGDNLSIEQAQIVRTANGPRICGLVLAAQEQLPLRVDYGIDCDPSWQTRRVTINQCFGGINSRLQFDHDGQGNWLRNGSLDDSLASCTDVDLGISPSTNTLPINRIAMAVGAVHQIKAAWIRFPELAAIPARQSYQRLSARKYEYRNRDSGFTASIAVDDEGLVTDYAGVWTRVAEGPGAPDASGFPDGSGFVDALISRSPSPEIGDAAEALGWLVGGWSAEVRDFDADGQVRSGEGEWWFSWVLEGRALQDVWIVPARAQRMKLPGNASHSSGANNRYGTTVRWFDRPSGQWRIVWVNPVSGAMNTLAGWRMGDRIVLEGEQDGHSIRWSLNEIRPDSFVWRGESRGENGSWRLDAEFLLRRIASAPTR